MKLEIPLHTIVFSVAPSGSGKSTFFTEMLIPSIKAKYPDLNVQYLSTDDIRRNILGDMSIDKLDVKMGYVSDLAFSLMYKQLEYALKPSVRAEIVIVDSTGLSATFIDSMKEHAKNNHYNVMPLLWAFKNRADYFKYSSNNAVTSKHLKNLNEKVIQVCSKRVFPLTAKIKEHPTSVEVEVLDYDFYKSHKLSNDIEYSIVSDVHGSYDELVELLTLNNAVVENGVIVTDKKFILQDYIDKGTQTKEVVELIHKNRDKFELIIGNHENFVYKYLKGEIKNPEQSLIDNYFDSIYLFEADEELKLKFFELFESSKHFFHNDFFFVNHAPCEGKYLGKIDSVSLKNMRNYFYTRRKVEEGETLEDYAKRLEDEEFNFIKRDYTYPFAKPVFWGHVAIGRVARINNVYMIDTGCVSGNKLTSFSIDRYNGKIYQKDVQSKTEPSEEGHVILFKNKVAKKLDVSELDVDDFRRIKFLGINKVNFISGTMCPADKNSETGELEYLGSALQYYKNKGVGRVILQKKYMGSASQVYLNLDVEKCYSVSRNGFIIDRKVDLKALYEKLLDKFRPYMEEQNFELLIINGELMPWNTLGKGLIEEQFQPIEIGIKTEFDVLTETGFFEKFNELKNHPLKDEFIIDSKNMPKAKLSEKYSHKDFDNLRNFCKFEKEIVSEDEYEKHMNVYLRQMELFARDGEIDFKPFGLLKGVRTDGTEKLYFEDSNIDIFPMISDDEYAVIDFAEEGYLEKAIEFNNRVTEDLEMEGIVVKPDIVYTPNVAPAVKVRNKNYLTIVYAYDYQKASKHEKLFKRKDVRRKLKASIEEFEIGKRMLEIPYNEIDKDNKAFNDICIEMVIDEKKTAKLDPRL